VLSLGWVENNVWTILAEDSAALSDTRVAGENGVTSSAWVDYWSAAPVAV
jgi:hypothetical protein